MERKILLIGLALTAGAVGLFLYERARGPLPGAAPETSATASPAPAIRGVAVPEFELANLDGTVLRKGDLRDKVLLVNFWATWCAPCEIEIPWFIDFDKKYREDGLEVIGISLDEEGPEVVKKYVAEHNVTYKIVMGNEETAETFGGVIGLPTTFMVDREGKFWSMHRGLVGKDVVEEEIVELLGISKKPDPEGETAPASWTP